MTAYKSVMDLYGRYIRVGQRVQSDLVLKDFEYLRDKAIELPDDGFRGGYLKVVHAQLFNLVETRSVSKAARPSLFF